MCHEIQPDLQGRDCWIQEKENTELQTFIRDDGLARQTIYGYFLKSDDERTVVNQTVELTDIGETTIERPDWYEEATETVSNDSDASSASEDPK